VPRSRDRGYRRIELAPGAGPALVRITSGQAAVLLGALDELGFELHEPIDYAGARYDVDLVEAQLDSRVAITDDPLAA
jgi:hypothetical protein